MAGLDGITVSQRDGRRAKGIVGDSYHRQVGIRVHAHDFRIGLTAVAEDDHDALGGLHNVPVGDHVAISVPNETGTAGPREKVAGHALRDVDSRSDRLDDAKADHRGNRAQVQVAHNLVVSSGDLVGGELGADNLT